MSFRINWPFAISQATLSLRGSMEKLSEEVEGSFFIFTSMLVCTGAALHKAKLV